MYRGKHPIHTDREKESASSGECPCHKCNVLEVFIKKKKKLRPLTCTWHMCVVTVYWGCSTSFTPWGPVQRYWGVVIHFSPEGSQNWSCWYFLSAPFHIYKLLNRIGSKGEKKRGDGSQCTHGAKLRGNILHSRVVSHISLLKIKFYSIKYLKPTHWWLPQNEHFIL